MLRKSFAAVLICVLLNSCLKAPKCEYDACAYVAPSAEIQALQNYISTNAIVATQHCSGVFYTIVTQGSGKSPEACSNILARYKGRLLNGTIFDQSDTGAYFSLGNLITAWRNVLPLLKTGGKMIMYVPPSLGYGNQAVGTAVPANSYLIFEIDLDAVQ